MNSGEEFVMTLRAGFMHKEIWGPQATTTASERGIRPGDAFELLLGGAGSAPAWIAIPEGVKVVVTLDRMHDSTWTERAVTGWRQELGKLGKVLEAKAGSAP